MDIELLDCTLRDGGYVNDWKFGKNVIWYMVNRYVKSKVDILEVGFLDERRDFDCNRSIFPTTEAIDQIIGKVDKGTTKFVAMIDYGTCSIDNVGAKTDTIIDGIRIIFKKKNMYNALSFADKIIEKGYFVTLQLVSITSYCDRDIIDFCEEANKRKIYAVSIVDTYGLMHREQMQHYFDLLDHNLNSEIAIGYHSHNNFQLAYSNTIEVLKINRKRKIILDGSAYGMGKSAGNAPIELIAMQLNENYGKEYDLTQFLEIIDSCILPIYSKTPWGYALLYFLSAANNCHPKYISYLMEKATLSVEAMNEVVKRISKEKLLDYDEKHITELYKKYQSEKWIDEKTLEAIAPLFCDWETVLIAPGSSVTKEKHRVESFMKQEHARIISVNFLPRDIAVDAVFVGNERRYSIIVNEIEKLDRKPLILATSNVTSVNDEIDYIISAEKLFDKRSAISDNSAAMLLNLMQLIGTKSLALIGFDGYRFGDEQDNYCGDSFSYSYSEQRLKLVNEQMADKINEMKQKMDIQFVTQSVYGK